MKIHKRIPLEQYAYEELEFESLADYEENYPKYVETFKRIRKQINNPDEVPFTSEELNNLPQ